MAITSCIHRAFQATWTTISLQTSWSKRNILTCICDALALILAETLDILTEIFCGFNQAFQARTGST
jgi:hypothetical protein